MKPLEKRVRVEVYDAGREKCLGKGWIVAKGISYIFTKKITCPECKHVTVILYTTPEKPSAEEIDRLKRRNIGVHTDKDDVMIKLDDGREVFGSSTWWQEIPEEEEEQQ